MGPKSRFTLVYPSLRFARIGELAGDPPFSVV